MILDISKENLKKMISFHFKIRQNQIRKILYSIHMQCLMRLDLSGFEKGVQVVIISYNPVIRTDCICSVKCDEADWNYESGRHSAL